MLSAEEWNLVGGWWAGRFDGGHDLLPEFEKTHTLRFSQEVD